MPTVADLPDFSRFQGEFAGTCWLQQVRGALRYMAASPIGTILRDASPAHLTRVRAIRIGLPQHVQLTAGRGFHSVDRFSARLP